MMDAASFYSKTTNPALLPEGSMLVTSGNRSKYKCTATKNDLIFLANECNLFKHWFAAFNQWMVRGRFQCDLKKWPNTSFGRYLGLPRSYKMQYNQLLASLFSKPFISTTTETGLCSPDLSKRSFKGSGCNDQVTRHFLLKCAIV